MAKNAKTHCINNATEYEMQIRRWDSDELNDKDKARIIEMLTSAKKNVDDALKIGPIQR